MASGDAPSTGRPRVRGRSRGIRRPTEQYLGGSRCWTTEGVSYTPPPPATCSPPPSVASLSSSMSTWTSRSAGPTSAMDALSLGYGPNVGAGTVEPQQFDDHVGGAEAGAAGQPIELLSNYFRLVLMPNWCVYKYHVDFAPSVESRKMRRTLLREHRDRFDSAYVFDGVSDLKMVKRLDSVVTELHSRCPTDGAHITIRLERIQELAPNHPEILRLFSTEMRRKLEQLCFVQVARHYFDGLEPWQGMATAIRQRDSGELFVVDTQHMVLRRESAVEVLVKIPSRRLVGIVMTPYNRLYRVYDIDWHHTPLSTFKHDNRDKTFVQYFKAQACLAGVHRYCPTTADVSRKIRDHRKPVSVNLHTWHVVGPRRESRACYYFVTQLIDVGRHIGINMSFPKITLLEDEHADTYGRGLRDSSGMELVLLVAPNNRKDRHHLKQACCDIGVPRQVVRAKTIANPKNLRSVATNVAIQLNCKLGGEAWRLEIPLSTAMIIGYDTHHDSSTKGQSAGAFVASMNRAFTRWYSRVTFHKTHQELGNTLAKNLVDAIGRYSQVNGGAVPDRIIIFRDGVSDEQIAQVKEWEIDQVVRATEELFPEAHQPKLAFVVVTKRISTRFFARANQMGMISNPPPGTVVDTEVTRPERYDFFLVSRSVGQGTVTPTHYNIIHDTTGLNPDHMQHLAYKLTYLYFNWPGTVRVPAPCQYAHKLAFLAGTTLHAEPHNKTTLFYQ